jgi:hypothetical protein
MRTRVAPEQRGRAGVIASELSVSVNTVNTHVRNIYAKQVHPVQAQVDAERLNVAVQRDLDNRRRWRLRMLAMGRGRLGSEEPAVQARDPHDLE